MDVAGRAPIQRCGLRSSTFQFFAVSSTTVLVKGLLPAAAAIVSESAAAIAMRRSATRAREEFGEDVNRGRYSPKRLHTTQQQARVPTWQLTFAGERKLLGTRRASQALAFAPRSMVDMMSSFFRSADFGCVSIRSKVSNPHAYGAQPRLCHPFGQRPHLCFSPQGSITLGRRRTRCCQVKFGTRTPVCGAPTATPPTSSRLTKPGYLWNRNPRCATLPCVPSRRGRNEAAPRGPALLPVPPRTSMQAYEITVDGCASGLGLGLDAVNRVTVLKAGRASRRLRPHCRRRSHRECGRRASRRPPITGGDAARRPARLRHRGG